MSPFRIIHLSDLHLTRSDGCKRTGLTFFSALRGMNHAFRQLLATDPLQEADLVLVTGDVTDRGEIDAWRVFWQSIDAAKLRARVLVVPGNHDVCCLGARLPRAGVGYTEADLQKAVAGLALGGQHTRFPWAEQVDPRVVVFGLNSNNLGNLTAATNAMGEIGYFQLRRLAELLYQHRDVPVKIIILHHSPNIPELETAKRRGTPPIGVLARRGHQIPREQRRGLMLLSVTHRVRLILHGHLHLDEERKIGGVPIIGAPASTEPTTTGAATVLSMRQFTVSGARGRILRERLSVTTG